jgi:catechol 2,3-dioxygenase-like lactoylglutathione lyase family enzyme
MLQRVDRLLYRVESVPSATRYWHAALGLHIVHQTEKLAVLRFPEGGVEVVLHDDPALPASAVYFLVESVREVFERRGELQLSFVAPPVQASRGFRAVARDPFGNVLLLIDRSLHNGDSLPAIPEDAKPPGSLFADVELKTEPRRELLSALYERTGRTADDLPYTPHFESIYEGYIRELPEPKPSRAEVWRHLLNLRKSGKLPRLGEALTPPPELDKTEREALRELLGEDIGRRDRLPYTTRFEELAEAFNRTQSRPMPPHLLWRAIASIAK